MVREAWMSFEPDHGFFCGAIRDDSVLVTNSSNTDDARCGTSKDDSVLVPIRVTRTMLDAE